ncbi:MAG: rhodanese-like domain-containing protein [Bacteroidaceae bacterium]|nr:rhodanese-like domain-containing protein [Bacteroidaceae bacterium]
MNRIIYPIVVWLMGISCQEHKAERQEPAAEKFQSVSVDEFAQVIADTNVVVLDVRTQEEHVAGHIAGTTLHIDVLKADFDSLAVANIKEKSTVALYCRSGNRSKRAASTLAGKGFQVIELATGYNGWVQAGKEVE